MIPTLSQVYVQARAHLADVVVPGGGRWTDQHLQPFLASAYSDLIKRAIAKDLDLVQRDAFPILPAYHSTLYPSAAGITNFGEPLDLAERGFLAPNSVTLTAIATPASARALCTAASHPFLTGQRVTIHGVSSTQLSPDINDEWPVEYVSGTQFYLLGPVSQGGGATAATATYSSERWTDMSGPLDPDEFTPSPAATAASRLGVWGWVKDRFQFPSCATARQLRIRYQLSDQLPVNSIHSLLVDGSLDFLAYATAGHALLNEAPSTAARFLLLAYGNPEGIAAALGGKLADLLLPQIRTHQRSHAVQRPPFRPRRLGGRYHWA